MIDPPLIVSMTSLSTKDAENIRTHLAGHQRGIVLWDIRRHDLVAACDRIATLAIAMPGILQVAATTDLSDSHRLMLAELRIAAMLRHPEDLPSIGRLVNRNFAPLTHPDKNLDWGRLN